MTSGPNVHGSMEKLLDDMRTRITLLERRLARAGGGGGGSSITAGMLQPFVGGSVPSGWLLCDGSEVDRTTYAELFSAVGTTFGPGDGSTTFNLPDMRGRTLVGADGATFGAIGDQGGAETHVHDLSSDTIAAISWSASASRVQLQRNTSSPATSRNVETSSNMSALAGYSGTSTNGIRVYGDTDPASSLQPYTVVNWLIAASG